MVLVLCIHLIGPPGLPQSGVRRNDAGTGVSYPVCEGSMDLR